MFSLNDISSALNDCSSAYLLPSIYLFFNFDFLLKIYYYVGEGGRGIVSTGDWLLIIFNVFESLILQFAALARAK